MLADSNLIIYAAAQKYPALSKWFAKEQPFVSAISLVETLGYHGLKAKEKDDLKAIFSTLTVLYPTPQEFQIATKLRQQHSMSLGDALIASAAIYHQLTLATHNTKDFAWIEALKVTDPL